jgi:hypothetical protein
MILFLLLIQKPWISLNINFYEQKCRISFISLIYIAEQYTRNTSWLHKNSYSSSLISLFQLGSNIFISFYILKLTTLYLYVVATPTWIQHFYKFLCTHSGSSLLVCCNTMFSRLHIEFRRSTPIIIDDIVLQHYSMDCNHSQALLVLIPVCWAKAPFCWS